MPFREAVLACPSFFFSPQDIMARLRAADAALRRRPAPLLGPGVSAPMVGKADALGCFLGFLRPGKLECERC